MKRMQIILILIFGALAIWLEFRNIKEDDLFGLGLFDRIPLTVLCILTSIYLIKNTIQFKQTQQYISFLPVVVGIVFIAITFLHKQWRNSVDESPTLFIATNYDTGNDGGFIIDFKKSNYLKAEKRDHWQVTYYWGSYEKQGDTLLLHISLNFDMGRLAILRKDSLAFIDDTLRFEVSYPLPSSF